MSLWQYLRSGIKNFITLKRVDFKNAVFYKIPSSEINMLI
ncbi:Uncharacterized protein dnm_037870 [Desulfonema magnum]|uniref:Uncharacterized protein n=1 Tax=Desulfonema magnum TaxID=45655 RepID=A0A975GNG7_9BACT|nr:Uncharacterized protein dnm_037870 [Desulfonema magnum]